MKLNREVICHILKSYWSVTAQDHFLFSLLDQLALNYKNTKIAKPPSVVVPSGLQMLTSDCLGHCILLFLSSQPGGHQPGAPEPVPIEAPCVPRRSSLHGPDHKGSTSRTRHTQLLINTPSPSSYSPPCTLKYYLDEAHFTTASLSKCTLTKPKYLTDSLSSPCAAFSLY